MDTKSVCWTIFDGLALPGRFPIRPDRRRCLRYRRLARALDGADAVFHLAAIASVVRSNEDWVGTNRVQPGRHRGGAGGGAQGWPHPGGLRFLGGIYGNQPGGPVHEGLIPAPRSAYGADKLGSEVHAGIAFSVHGVPTFGVRFFNVYGPRQDAQSPYSGVISVLPRGSPIRSGWSSTATGGSCAILSMFDDAVRHLRAGLRLFAGRAAGRGW